MKKKVVGRKKFAPFVFRFTIAYPGNYELFIKNWNDWGIRRIK